MTGRPRLARIVVGAGLAVLLVACTGDPDADPTTAPEVAASPSEAPPTPTTAPRTPGVAQVTEAGSVLEIVRTREELTGFAQLVETFLAAGGRDGVFLQERGITLLAPQSVPDDVIAALQADDALLSRFIGEHLVVGDVAAADLRPRITVANGTIHRATRRRVAGQELVRRNLRASNGRVHVVAGPLAALDDLVDG